MFNYMCISTFTFGDVQMLKNAENVDDAYLID